MKIGIIGAGNVGTGLGRRLAAAGHDIVISFARTEAKIVAASELIGHGARAGSVRDAVEHADVIIVATPWGATLEAVAPIASAAAGKVVWDTTNPFAPDMSELLIGTTTSAGETLAAAMPDARVVKAVPPFAEMLHSPSMRLGDRRPGVFVCGDDATAREWVMRLVEDIDAEGVDAGPLKLARFTEPLGMLITNLAYVRGLGARIGAVLIRDV